MGKPVGELRDAGALDVLLARGIGQVQHVAPDVAGGESARQMAVDDGAQMLQHVRPLRQVRVLGDLLTEGHSIERHAADAGAFAGDAGRRSPARAWGYDTSNISRGILLFFLLCLLLCIFLFFFFCRVTPRYRGVSGRYIGVTVAITMRSDAIRNAIRHV